MIIKLTDVDDIEGMPGAVYVNTDNIMTIRRYPGPGTRSAYTKITMVNGGGPDVTETPEKILSIIAMKGAHS